jgi:hypothetical protein
MSAPLPRLLQCLQHYAQQQSNPVLEVLQGESPIVQQRRYPDPAMEFGDGHWRAFYHCHNEEFRFAGEHGHFHLFARVGEAQWSHVVGLCMDPQGQPLRWFTVNHWVCGGEWCAAESLIAMLERQSRDQGPLLAQWLMAMMSLYRSELAALLMARDQRLQQSGAQATLLENRDIYLLSETQVDLLSKIKTVM